MGFLSGLFGKSPPRPAPPTNVPVTERSNRTAVKDSWECVRSIQVVKSDDPNEKIIYQVEFFPNGSVLAVGSGAGQVQLLASESLEAVGVFKLNAGSTEFSCHPSGDLIAVASGIIGERAVTVFNVRTQTAIKTISEKADAVRFCLGGSLLACMASHWNEVKLFRTADWTPTAPLKFSHTNSLMPSPDGTCLLCGGGCEIALFDVKTRSQRWKRSIADRLKGVAFSPDGRHIVAGCDGNGDIQVFDLDGNNLNKFGGRLFVPISGDGAFSKDGRFVAFPASYGVMISSWSQKEKLKLLDTRSLSAVTFSPCGTRLIAGTWVGSVMEFHLT